MLVAGRRILTLAVLLAGPPTALAGVPDGGWPQMRHDPALSGRSPELGLSRVRLAWTAPAGRPLSGEPAVLDCTVAVTNDGGDIVAFNARSGEPLWATGRPWSVTPSGVASALAFDDANTLYAGLPSDPFIVRAFRAYAVLRTALASYAIDNNSFPDTADLAAALTPTYIRELPPNPVTGNPIVSSDTPSLGDYRFAADPPSFDDYNLGIWGVEDGLLDFGEGCVGTASGSGGLAPSWPRSPEQGGTPSAFDATTGAVLWLDRTPALALAVRPSLASDGVAWSSLELTPETYWQPWWGGGGWGNDLVMTGRARRHLADGTSVLNVPTLGPARGGVALDALAQSFQARGPTATGVVFDSMVHDLAQSVESYSIDNNVYPPSGELAPEVVPIYLQCMPVNIYTRAAAVHVDAPVPGDYTYETNAAQDEYTITVWNDRGEAAARMETGSPTIIAEDEGPRVTSLSPDGSFRWSVSMGDANVDLTPVSLLPSGSVVVGTSYGELVWLSAADGSEQRRLDLGAGMSLAPAQLSDGGLVVVTTGSNLIRVAADGSEAWRQWLGATVTAAPTTTADDIIYIADLDGVLRAFAEDGELLWESYLGGLTRAGLTTAVVQSEGWLYVGRSDGTLLAAVPELTAGRPLDPFPLLPQLGVRGTTTAGFEWHTVPLASDPGAHYHLRRWRGSLLGMGEDLLGTHPSLGTSHVDDDASGDLIFYRLHAADCGENSSVSAP